MSTSFVYVQAAFGVVALAVAAVVIAAPAVSWVREKLARLRPGEHRPEWDRPMGEEFEEYWDDEDYYAEVGAVEDLALLDRLEAWASLHSHCLAVGNLEAAAKLVEVVPAVAQKQLPEVEA